MLATMSDAVREYAHNAGRELCDSAWILSPYDTWERNPFYQGPPQPHPEEDRYDDEEGEPVESHASSEGAWVEPLVDNGEWDILF